MKYPRLEEIPTSRDWIDVFLGYNHNERIGSGEFYEMTNLTSDEYPVICPRKRRTQAITIQSGSTPDYKAIIGKDALCYIDGNEFYVNEYKVDNLTLNNNTPKKLISMGAYVIIMPDKVYVNTQNLTDFGPIEERFTYNPGGNASVVIKMCMLDGEELETQIEKLNEKMEIYNKIEIDGEVVFSIEKTNTNSGSKTLYCVIADMSKTIAIPWNASAQFSFPTPNGWTMFTTLGRTSSPDEILNLQLPTTQVINSAMNNAVTIPLTAPLRFERSLKVTYQGGETGTGYGVSVGYALDE